MDVAAAPTLVHADNPGFFHVRMILGVIVSLALAKILTGVARFVQEPDEHKASLLHMLWALVLFIMVLHFWWFEFALSTVTRWQFEAYAFLVLFAALHFFIASLLFPDKLQDDEGYEQYFHRHRTWFFVLFACIFAFDTIDTLIKGWRHYYSLGPWYPWRQAGLVGLALSAMLIDNRKYHLGVVVKVLILQVAWIAHRYAVLT